MSQPMTILMTGATGLVGQALGKELSKLGHTIRVLSRSGESAGRELPFPCKSYFWDPLKQKIDQEALLGVDGIIHLAGENVSAGRWTKVMREKIVKSRVDSTAFLRSEFSNTKQKLRFYMGASAVGIYGDRADETLDETSAKGRGFLSDVVEAWEAEHNKWSICSDKVLICRLGVVLAREGGALQKLLFPASQGVLGALGSGRNWMSWVSLHDVVRAFLWGIQSQGAQGVYNIVAPQVLTNRDFTRILNKRVGSSNFVGTPAWSLKLVLGQMSDVLLHSQRVESKRLEAEGFKFEHGLLHEALGEIFPKEFERGDFWVHYEQWLPKPPDELFEFFKDEKNLETITPSFLGFKILSKSTPHIEKGTVLRYRLKIHGVPMTWVTLISEFSPPDRFVDFQKKGPYKKWHHTHTFIPHGSGTLVVDTVVYRLPFGPLGRLGAHPWVLSDVGAIFSYRRKILAGKFYSS